MKYMTYFESGKSRLLTMRSTENSTKKINRV